MADIRLGNNNTSYKVGSGDCTIYLGTTLLYSGGTPPTPPHDYSLDYLTFTATESGTFKFIYNTSEPFEYSLDDGETWEYYESGMDSPTVNAGEKIMWKALILGFNDSNGIGTFSSTGAFTVEGNIMSLLYYDLFVGETDLTHYNRAFMYLFSGCTGITSAENLILPATTLTTACYRQMFDGCTNLTTAPALPATTLASFCYHAMFRNCTSLTTAPELPATTLAESCYNTMFRGCTNLNNITCLAIDISASSCLTAWVRDVQTTSGTFTKASSMSSWTTGYNGIPTNWTVVDYTG